MSDLVRPTVLVAATLSGGLRAGLEARYRVVESVGEGAEARVVVTNGSIGLAPALAAALPGLALVAVQGVGLDRIDLAAMRRRGVAVANTPDVLTDDVADMALGLVVATARRIVANDALVRRGGWAGGAAIPFGMRLTGARFGIVGLGRIGRAIAARLAPFGGTIGYHNRRPASDVPFRYYATATALAADVDVLVLAAPGVAGAAPIIDADVLAALGPAGVLVNVGRGASVDEGALVAALAERRILGAGLDVFAFEPDVPTRLLALDNVVLQPHQGSATEMARRAMAELVLRNVERFFSGEPLVTPVALA